MGFRIHCDACGSYIKTVGIREIRDMNYVDDNPTHCTGCTQRFEVLSKKIIKLQANYERKLDNVMKKAQADAAKLVQELSED